MFSTEVLLYVALFTSFLGLTLGLASVVIVRSARNYAAGCVKWLQQTAPKTQIAELSAEITELTDAYAALLKSHKKLRSRITMRENRAKRVDPDPDTDLSSETDKKALRLAARQSGLLK